QTSSVSLIPAEEQVMTPLRQRMLEDMKLRNYAPLTIKVYVERVATFAQHFGESPRRLGAADVRAYLLFLVQEKHASWSYYGQAQGQKDRYVMLSPRLLAILRAYWKADRPTPFLFPGNVPDRPITPRTVEKACRDARAAAGLGKHVTVHTLRHNADCRIMPTG